MPRGGWLHEVRRWACCGLRRTGGPSPGSGAFSSSPYTVPLCWVWGPSIAVLWSCQRIEMCVTVFAFFTYLLLTTRGDHQRSSRGRFEWSARFHRPSRRVAGPGKRHSARGTPRAQPRDVRSAGRDTWNLTGEALGGPRKRSWRRCSRARSGRRSAIRGAHSGALDRPEPSDPAARAPIRTSAPYSAADASGSSCAAGARLR